MDTQILLVDDGLGNLLGKFAGFLVGHVFVLVLAFQRDVGRIVIVPSDAVFGTEFLTVHLLPVS